jgi:hypothetical protein
MYLSSCPARPSWRSSAGRRRQGNRRLEEEEEEEEEEDALAEMQNLVARIDLLLQLPKPQRTLTPLGAAGRWRRRRKESKE